MTLDLDLQIATTAVGLPSAADFEHWATAVLRDRRARAALTIRLVGSEEGAELNLTYRGRRGPTNVLSFPFDLPPGVGAPDPIADLLGDLVICADVVRQEAAEQGKPEQAHWAHLVIHGVLHLLGEDHQTEAEAESMERQEIAVLARLGFPSPYEDD